jgi:hypothetical protein
MDRAAGGMVCKALDHTLQGQPHERVVEKHHQRTFRRLKPGRIHGLDLDANSRMPLSKRLKISPRQRRQIAGHFDSDQLAKSGKDSHGQSPAFPATVVHESGIGMQPHRQALQDIQCQPRVDPLILNRIGQSKPGLTLLTPNFPRKECRQAMASIKRPLGGQLADPLQDTLSPQGRTGERRVFSDHPEMTFGGNNRHGSHSDQAMRPRSFRRVTFPSH